MLFAIPALAGGAATVVLDKLPRTVHAGEEFQLGFTVWQHGIHLVDTFGGVGDVKPVLIATHQTSGETFQAEVYKAEGAEVATLSSMLPSLPTACGRGALSRDRL